MAKYRCEQCYWKGTIETQSSPDESRQCVESTALDHCPICGMWGLVEV